MGGATILPNLRMCWSSYFLQCPAQYAPSSGFMPVGSLIAEAIAKALTCRWTPRFASPSSKGLHSAARVNAPGF
jgi:hypothetical protein